MTKSAKAPFEEGTLANLARDDRFKTLSRPS